MDAKLTKRHIGLDWFVDGGKFSDADRVLGGDAERVLSALGQPGRLVLQRFRAGLSNLGPRRPRSFTTLDDVSGDQCSSVGLGRLPRHGDVVLVAIHHFQIHWSRGLVCIYIMSFKYI